MSQSFNRNDFLKSLDRFYRAIEEAGPTPVRFGAAQLVAGSAANGPAKRRRNWKRR